MLKLVLELQILRHEIGELWYYVLRWDDCANLCQQRIDGRGVLSQAQALGVEVGPVVQLRLNVCNFLFLPIQGQ